MASFQSATNQILGTIAGGVAVGQRQKANELAKSKAEERFAQMQEIKQRELKLREAQESRLSETLPKILEIKEYEAKTARKVANLENKKFRESKQEPKEGDLNGKE